MSCATQRWHTACGVWLSLDGAKHPLSTNRKRATVYLAAFVLAVRSSDSLPHEVVNSQTASRTSASCLNGSVRTYRQVSRS